MSRIGSINPFANLWDIAAILALFIISQLMGCAAGPQEVAKFYIESQLKANDKNARTLVVSDQQEEYSNPQTVMKILFSKMNEGESRPPEVDAIARTIASSVVLKEIEKSSEKIVYEYSFDTGAIRKGLEKKGIGEHSLLNTTIREAFLSDLEKFNHRLVLVKEKNKWKVDYTASN